MHKIYLSIIPVPGIGQNMPCAVRSFYLLRGSLIVSCIQYMYYVTFIVLLKPNTVPNNTATGNKKDSHMQIHTPEQTQ